MQAEKQSPETCGFDVDEWNEGSSKGPSSIVQSFGKLESHLNSCAALLCLVPAMLANR